MTNTTKLTKADKFVMVLAMLDGKEVDSTIIREFVEHELELLSNRNKSNSNAKAKKAEADAPLRQAIKDALAVLGEVSVSQLMRGATNEVALLSSQKITYLLTGLVKDGEVFRKVVKKVPLYSVTPFKDGDGATE